MEGGGGGRGRQDWMVDWTGRMSELVCELQSRVKALHESTDNALCVCAQLENRLVRLG